MAEGNGLLNRRRGKTSTEGSNPSLSANLGAIEAAGLSTTGQWRASYTDWFSRFVWSISFLWFWLNEFKASN